MLRRSEFAFERGTLRETEVDVSFHFSCFACCLKQTLPKTNRSFHSISVVQSFVARCCKMQCAARNNLKSHYAYHGCDGGLTLRFTF